MFCKLGYIIVTILLVVSKICHSKPLPQRTENDETANSSGPNGLLDIPPDPDADDEEDDSPSTTKKPSRQTTTTTTKKPQRSEPSGLLDIPTRKPQRGARIVFQPLWQVALNAATKGVTSALVPIVKNEQPTGVQYGSIPISSLSLLNDDDEDNPNKNSTSKSASSNDSSSIIVNLLNPMRNWLG